MTEKIPSRGIYLLPSILTTFGMFAGFYSIIASINGDFTLAAISIMVAMLWDALDGRVARLTNTQSDFGAQYDSLADLVSFGVAPALLVYEWSLSDLGRIGWLAAFIFLACAALRLARFNTQVGASDKRYFQGLPSPAAAGVIASMIWLKFWKFEYFDFGIVSLSYYVGVGITIVCALLMVSNVRYYSFKELDSKKASFRFLLAIVLSLIVLLSKPNIFLFTGFFVYMLSGPFITITGLNKKRIQKKQSQDR
ncbi:MAG: CDP-diacylglycerol--serine O-phosphatidyltransferase [Gammaproteobacteria bacterium]|nr:CDP-diacylglycerol--serine O-phosphatidyltransferase [Gammaproteobacteria bacterium]